MKIFISFNHRLIGIILALFIIQGLNGQDKMIDVVDSAISNLNMDAVYNRPFLTSLKSPVSVGGYVEVNSIYTNENGVSEGISFQARRLTLFMSSSITSRIKFLSEIEFEDGAKEIAIEFAAIDLSIHPMFNVRGGIIMNPIGAFNQNHDGPKWEFIERPDVSVNLLPATWSNAGFGIFGKTWLYGWVIGYETYLTNGFNNSIIDNKVSRTYLPASKENDKRFEESSNGKPTFTGKISAKNRAVGEIGISYMGGIYNQFESDGITLDKMRRLNVFAIDINKTIQLTRTYLVGEMAFINIDIPNTYTQQYGDKQRGFFIDIVQPVMNKAVLNWENATLNLAVRFDHVNWNIGTFNETGKDIGDYLWAISPAISFRPTPQTVFRANYRYQWQTDLLNNHADLSSSWLFGFSSYF